MVPQMTQAMADIGSCEMTRVPNDSLITFRVSTHLYHETTQA